MTDLRPAWHVDKADDEDEGDIPSAFASELTLLPALQQPQEEAKALSVRNPPGAPFRRTPHSTHPLIFSHVVAAADRTPSRAERSRLLRAVTGRDAVILQALHDWRY